MTSYDEILDLALVSIEDYRLNKLATDSPADFKIVLEGFMIRGLPHFDNCTKDLGNRNDEARYFYDKLDDIEKSILADWTVIMWLDKEIHDVRQITAMMQNNKEAHRYSEASNLNAKVSHRIQMYEDVHHKQSRYSYKNTKWKDWANGNFDL